MNRKKSTNFMKIKKQIKMRQVIKKSISRDKKKLAEIKNPHAFVLPTASYYRVQTEPSIIKTNTIDWNKLSESEKSNLVTKHVAGNNGKAPKNSPFFSVTTCKLYTERFLEFLLQYGKVYVMCFNKDLKPINALDYVKGNTFKNWVKNASEYLVCNKINKEYIDSVLIFDQQIFELGKTYLPIRARQTIGKDKILKFEL